MFRLIKFVIYLIIFAAIGLLAFAYLGPLFGVDFSAPQTLIRLPLEVTPD